MKYVSGRTVANNFISNRLDHFLFRDRRDSLGGETLIAPGGNRADASDQDAIVTYSLDFSEAGTYTAYYRARGFNGGTNSIYVPTDFGANPPALQTLLRQHLEPSVRKMPNFLKNQQLGKLPASPSTSVVSRVDKRRPTDRRPVGNKKRPKHLL